jgi:curved DNA-binding protein CbpA
MPTFTQDLREKVAKSLLPQQQKNPLRTIGLSSLILELGLSDDELYEYCKSMARDLVVHFHPDRIGTAPTAVEHQRRFAGAFEALKDREVFDGALLEFKRQHSEETSERSQEQKITTTQRDLLDETRTRLVRTEGSVKETNQRYEWVKDRFFSHLRLRGATFSEEVVSQLKAVGIQQTIHLNLLVFDPYYACTVPDRSSVRQFVDEYRSITERKGWDKQRDKRFRERLMGARIGSARVNDLIREALDSDELFPTVGWSPANGYQKLGLTRFAGGGNHHRRHRGNSNAKSNLTISQLSGLYRNALASLGKLMAARAEGVHELAIRFESVEVNRGFIGFGNYRYPMLGTLRFEDINPLLFHLMLDTNVPDDTVLEKLQPVLAQGDLLVWQSLPTLYKVKKGKDMARTLREAGKHLKGYNISCVVLEAIAGDFD